MRWVGAALAVVVVASCSSGGDAAVTTTSSTTTTTSTTVVTTTTTAIPDDRPPPMRAAIEVASVLETAEGVIHDEQLADDDPRVAKAAHWEQVAVRALVDHPEWDGEVVGRLPAEWRSVAIENAAAGRSLRALVGAPRPKLPAWRIVGPAPADELRRYYEEAEARWGVPWEYLAAVHLVETKMGRIRGTSTAGAKGPMQFLPSTWAAYGEGDIESNPDSILAAARYLAANGGARGDLPNALYRYNHSQRYVDAVTRYAKRMEADPMAYRGYWGWQVYYWSTLGDVWLRVGWSLDAPRPVTPSDLE